jgi:hypothetical protein
MADVIEIRVVELRRLAKQTHRQADPKSSPPSGDAANDAALGHSADNGDDDLHVARGFAAAFAVGALLWVAVGAVLWIAFGALAWLGLP